MLKPDQMESFDVLYSLASADGRGEALFGNSIELARPVYEKTLIGDDYPIAYLEFPLLGEPCFDILSVHAAVSPGDKFAPGAGFGRQDMYDWFATVSDGKSISCGLEMDTSTGETQAAGVYFQQRRRTELVAPFLESIGESARLKSYMDLLERMPEGWPPAYVGLFPGREGTPLRLGGYMGRDAQKACSEDPQQLAAFFDRIGFSAYNRDMLERCSTFMSLAPTLDFQFDIFPDGSLGPTFGLSLSFNETKPREAQECMSTGYGADIMQLLEKWGLADERWRLIADAAFARHIPVEAEDGSMIRYALCILFNFAKVKFTNGDARPAKFYFMLRGDVLEEEQEEEQE